jgi:organic radical activating enzyme
MSPEATLEAVLAYPAAKRVCFTGGEPVIAPKASFLWLLAELRGRGYWTSIETSGARVVPELFEWVDFWTVSPKGTSARTFDGDPVEAQVPTLQSFLALAEGRRQMKFVLQNEADVEDAVRILDALGYKGSVVLQPEHGSGDGKRIFECWPWGRYQDARLIPQTHKLAGLR